MANWIWNSCWNLFSAPFNSIKIQFVKISKLCFASCLCAWFVEFSLVFSEKELFKWSFLIAGADFDLFEVSRGEFGGKEIHLKLIWGRREPKRGNKSFSSSRKFLWGSQKTFCDIFLWWHQIFDTIWRKRAWVFMTISCFHVWKALPDPWEELEVLQKCSMQLFSHENVVQSLLVFSDNVWLRKIEIFSQSKLSHHPCNEN